MLNTSHQCSLQQQSEQQTSVGANKTSLIHEIKREIDGLQSEMPIFIHLHL